MWQVMNWSRVVRAGDSAGEKVTHGSQHGRQVHLQTPLRAGLGLLRAINANQCPHGPDKVSFTHNILQNNVHAFMSNRVLVVCKALLKTVVLFLGFGQFITVV